MKPKTFVHRFPGGATVPITMTPTPPARNLFNHPKAGRGRTNMPPLSVASNLNYHSDNRLQSKPL